MSKLLKERWNRLAFAKNNQSLNESDRFHGKIPLELWKIGDYEDYRDSRINLRQFADDELQMKIEQLLEEIEEEKEYMDDPQSQYDTAIAPKESLIDVIQDILDQGVHQIGESVRNVLAENASHPEKGECPDIYEWQKLVSIAQSMLMGRYSGRGEPPTGFVRAWNRYKSQGMNIPGILYDSVPNCATAIMQIGSQQYELGKSDYKIVCDNWMTDAEEMDQFDWDYEG